MATAQALIPVFSGTINNEHTLLCDARKLHAFLKVGKRFASWATERIAEYGFVENQDFVIFSQIREKRRGRPSTDYHLTLDTAKELSMVERNEQGRIIRRYFIECERRLLSIAHGATQTTVDERTPLRAAVGMLVGKKSLLYPDAYAIVHQRFGVTSIDQLSLEQIPQAVEYVHRLVLEGEILPPEPLALAINIHYPISRWVDENPQIARAMTAGQVNITSKMLYGMDSRSASMHLFGDLARAGYNVEACRLEVQSMRHFLETLSYRLHTIQTEVYADCEGTLNKRLRFSM